MSRVLSLIIEQNNIKVVLIKKEKEIFACEAISSFFCEDSIVKELYIVIPSLVTQDFLFATALDSHEVLFRSLTLPIANRSKAIKALPFQLEASLPFPIEEAVVASALTPIGHQVFGVHLFAASHSTLQSHLNQWQELQIEPDFITAIPAALNRLARKLFPEEELIHLIYIGERQSCCVMSENNQITMTQTLYFGHADLVDALLQDFPEQSRDEIIAFCKGGAGDFFKIDSCIHFNRTKNKIAQEIQRFMLYLKNKKLLDRHEGWVLLGDLYSLFPYREWFDHLKPITECRCLSIDLVTLHEYALPLGIALDAHSLDAQSIQFRQSPGLSLRCKLKRKKQGLCFFVICMITAGVMGCGSFVLLKNKEKALLAQLTQYLPSAVCQAPLESTEELDQVLWQWEKSLGSKKLPFPFLLTVPSVSDVLAWLSTHPCLSTLDGGKKEGIEIKNIGYQLYKYPKLGELGGIYAAKVELELYADTPRLAREFHDALLKGDMIVDGKKEIKWNVQQNTYRVSFELRNWERIK